MAKDKKKKGFGKRWKKDQDRLGVYTPVTPGTYKAIIEDAKIGPTKAGDGRTLSVKYKLLSGEEKGRFITEFLTFEHPNPVTEEIAAQHIASLCDATGIDLETFDDETELKGKKLTITVAITPGNNDYGPGNKISAYDEAKGKGKDEEPDKKEKKKDKKNKGQEEEKSGKEKGEKKKDKKSKKEKPF